MKSKFIIGNDATVISQLDELLLSSDIIHMHFNVVGEYDKNSDFYFAYHLLVCYKPRETPAVVDLKAGDVRDGLAFKPEQTVLILSKEYNGYLGTVGSLVMIHDGIQYSVSLWFDNNGNEILNTSVLIDERDLTLIVDPGEIKFGVYFGAKVRIRNKGNAYFGYCAKVVDYANSEGNVLITVQLAETPIGTAIPRGLELHFDRSDLVLLGDF